MAAGPTTRTTPSLLGIARHQSLHLQKQKHSFIHPQAAAWPPQRRLSSRYVSLTRRPFHFDLLPTPYSHLLFGMPRRAIWGGKPRRRQPTVSLRKPPASTSSPPRYPHLPHFTFILFFNLYLLFIYLFVRHTTQRTRHLPLLLVFLSFSVEEEDGANVEEHALLVIFRGRGLSALLRRDITPNT